MERDLLDGVQNELVALVVKLALANEDAGIPLAVAKTLAWPSWSDATNDDDAPDISKRCAAASCVDHAIARSRDG